MVTTLFVLWLYIPTTKGMEWHPDRAWETKEQCETYAPIGLNELAGKGPAEKWRCVRYHR
jgi:hypothetical protein